MSEVLAKIGPSDITEPTPVNPITIPMVIARASECAFRNRKPSATSLPTLESSNFSPVWAASPRSDSLLTMYAENPNVPASSHSARNSWFPWKYDT